MQHAQAVGVSASSAALTSWSTAGPNTSSRRRVLVAAPALLLSGLLIPPVLVATGAGLLVPGVYRDAPVWAAQARGQDLVTLLVAVPLLVAGLIGAARGSVRSLLVWIGAVAYLAYAYATYAFGAHFNPLFLVYVASFGLALYALVLGLVGVDAGTLAATFPRSAPTRLVGTSLIAMGLLTAALWLAQDVSAIASGRVPASVTEAGLLTNPIHVLDLAIVLPGAVLTGALLLRRRPWGFILAASFLVKFATLGLATISMSLFMLAEHQPFDLSLSVVFSVWTIGAVFLAWRYLSSLSPPGHRP
jgi:hypothetical protein